MSFEQRRALRIALTFTVSFIAAELLRADLQLTFLAPLVAASLACQPKVPGRVALVLPLIAWTMVAIAGLMLQFLIDKPVVLSLLLLWVFWGGFTLLRDPRLGTLGLIILLVFAIVPQTLIKAPELDADLAWWFTLDFALAVAADLIFRGLLPEPPPPQPIMLPPLLSPLGAAVALLLAVAFTAALQLPAPWGNHRRHHHCAEIRWWKRFWRRSGPVDRGSDRRGHGPCSVGDHMGCAKSSCSDGVTAVCGMAILPADCRGWVRRRSCDEVPERFGNSDR